MRVSYQIDDRFFTGDTTKLIKRCEAARTVIQTQLTDVSPKLGCREMSFVCKAEQGNIIEMNLQISFPGASAFAQVRWHSRGQDDFINIPSVQDIVDAFMTQSEDGTMNVAFCYSRVGKAIWWALEKGLPNITNQYQDSLQFEDFDLESLSKVSA